MDGMGEDGEPTYALLKPPQSVTVRKDNADFLTKYSKTGEDWTKAVGQTIEGNDVLKYYRAYKEAALEQTRMASIDAKERGTGAKAASLPKNPMEAAAQEEQAL